MLSSSTKFFIFFIIFLALLAIVWVFVYAPAPAPEAVSYDTNRPERGNPQAKVVVTEYADFSCIHCQALKPEMDNLYQKYSAQVKFTYRYLPISQASIQIDIAAECAQRQGFFWPYANILFANNGVATDTQLLDWATQLPLNQAAFQQCLSQKATLPVVEYDIAQAFKLDINSAPTVFVNSEPVDNSALESAITRALAAQP